MKRMLCWVFHDRTEYTLSGTSACVMRLFWLAPIILGAVALAVMALAIADNYHGAWQCRVLATESGHETKWRTFSGCYIDPEGDGTFIPVERWINTQEVGR